MRNKKRFIFLSFILIFTNLILISQEEIGRDSKLDYKISEDGKIISLKAKTDNDWIITATVGDDKIWTVTPPEKMNDEEWKNLIYEETGDDYLKSINGYDDTRPWDSIKNNAQGLWNAYLNYIFERSKASREVNKVEDTGPKIKHEISANKKKIFLKKIKDVNWIITATMGDDKIWTVTPPEKMNDEEWKKLIYEETPKNYLKSINSYDDNIGWESVKNYSQSLWNAYLNNIFEKDNIPERIQQKKVSAKKKEEAPIQNGKPEEPAKVGPKPTEPPNEPLYVYITILKISQKEIFLIIDSNLDQVSSTITKKDGLWEFPAQYEKKIFNCLGLKDWDDFMLFFKTQCTDLSEISNLKEFWSNWLDLIIQKNGSFSL